MRKKINEEKFLHDLAEESILKDWNSPMEGEREFSESYREFRRSLIEQAETGKKGETEEMAEIIAMQPKKTKRKRFFKMPAGAAAAIAAVVLLSVGAYAISGLFHVESKEYTDESIGEYSYTFEAQEGAEVQPMQIVLGYLPEGYEFTEGAGERTTFGKYHKADGSGGLTIGIQDYSRQIRLPFISSEEETEINGIKTDILTRDGEIEYNHILLMFYEEEGQIVTMYGYKDISVDELKKVAENLSLEPTGEATYVPEAADKGEEPQVYSESAPQILDENVVRIGESIPIRNGLSFTVKNIELKDNLSGLPEEYFSSADHYEEFINEDGTIQSAEIGGTVWENNAMVEKSEGISPVKFAYVTLEIANTSEADLTDQYVYTSMVYRNPETNEAQMKGILGGFWRASGMEPVYYDGSDYMDGENNKHLFFSDFKAGETRTVHLGLFCLETEADNAYLVFRDWTGELEPLYVKLKM